MQVVLVPIMCLSYKQTVDSDELGVSPYCMYCTLQFRLLFHLLLLLLSFLLFPRHLQQYIEMRRDVVSKGEGS